MISGPTTLTWTALGELSPDTILEHESWLLQMTDDEQAVVFRVCSAYLLIEHLGFGDLEWCAAPLV